MHVFHEISHQSPVCVAYVPTLSVSDLFDFVALRLLDYREGNSLLGRPRLKWEENNKPQGGRINMAPDGHKWRDIMQLIFGSEE
jgi:hypothetical protein